jgi:hypothetical protein
MPQFQEQHQRLSLEMRQAIRRNDVAAMEAATRAGVALLPDNAVWRYNLACALAQRGRADAALDELDRAIDLGFANPDSLLKDNDLEPLRSNSRFTRLVSKARERLASPGTGSKILALPVAQGLAWVTPSNTVWDFDLGKFNSFFDLSAFSRVAAAAVALPGSAGDAVRAWQAEGTAAGNRGDLYDNRDDGHSPFDLTGFPDMIRVRYGIDARQQNAHIGIAQFLYNGVVLGNSSMALTVGPFWRSSARVAYSDGKEAAFLSLQYFRNHLYVYPAHRDYDASHHGDVFPANTPYVLIAQGSSGCDQPVLRAVALTLAAFRPDVKTRLTQLGLLAPTVQAILRACQTNVSTRADYLSGRAHPPVFDPAAFDPLRMARMAHGMATNALPPLAALRVEEEDTVRPGVDFFDNAVGEGLFDTPAAVARVVRGPSYRRRIVVDAAASRDLQGLPLAWHWVLLRGDPAKVKIRPLDAEGRSAEIVVAYHGTSPVEPGRPLQGSRVDVGVFVSNAHHVSAPAFVTLFYLANEHRTYSADGRVLAIDYGSATNRYADPVLTLPRNWKDVYRYDGRGRLLGWTRVRGPQSTAFAPDGARVETTDELGRPHTARVVQYVRRSVAGDPVRPPDLVEVDTSLRLTYRYASEDDATGEVVSRENVAE